MSTLQQLLLAARAVAPQVEIKFRGTADETLWVCIVTVGRDIVLFETQPGLVDEVIDDAARKLKGMSQKMRAVLSDGPPSSDPEPQ